MNFPQITTNGLFDHVENTNFFIIKITFAIESFVVLLYQNNLATTTALKGKNYVPVRKIDLLT